MRACASLTAASGCSTHTPYVVGIRIPRERTPYVRDDPPSAIVATTPLFELAPRSSSALLPGDVERRHAGREQQLHRGELPAEGRELERRGAELERIDVSASALIWNSASRTSAPCLSTRTVCD